jgi:glutamate-ammonia-ligase adenylyltransferase
MISDDSGVNLPMAALPAELASTASTRYAALRKSVGDALPTLEELPGDAARVLACSDYVAHSCTRHPDMFRELLECGDLERSYEDSGATGYRSRTAIAVATNGDDAGLMQALRALKRREMVRIAWRDIGALASFGATLRETSAFADAVLQTSVERLHESLLSDAGEPLASDGSPQHLVVLALGKLGAGELNFSSDIDLIFCFPEAGRTSGGRKELSNDEYFRRLGQRLIKVLSERTDAGFVFRVDMRLRPFGTSGPMALNFDAFEDYYQSHGRDWERYALIRARAVTGEPARGDEILERLRPFVYRRYFDFGALQSIRDMKALITDEIERKGLHDNIKLGPGGIREIEFTGQAFQMVRGGRQPELRDRHILRVIEILGERGHLPEYAVNDLCDAYRFLRTTEHRMQQVADRQEHTLPGEDAGRAALAAGMGFADWNGFARVLAQHRQRVNAQFSQVFGGEVETSDSDEALRSLWSGTVDGAAAVAVLQAEGYAEAEEAWKHISRVRETHALKLMDASARGRLARLIPDLLRAVAGQAQPLATLQRVFHIVEAVARRSAYLALLAERPLALSQLVRLCAASPWIARELGRHPVLLDELLDPRSLYAPLNQAALEADIDQRLSVVDDQDLEQEMEVLRQFKHANVLHVAAADVARVMPLMVVSDHLTAIAEVTLRKVLALAWRDMARRYGEPRMGDDDAQPAPFAIAAYGKLGGLELGYGSDLDIVFLHASQGGQQRTDGEKSVDNAVFFARLGQRIIHYLTTATAEGTLYELDFRLRPAGAKGLLVNGIEALRDYMFNEAWTWEHQALVRARVVAGNPALRERFADIRREVLLTVRDAETLKREVREMRQRMRETLGSGASSTKVEFDLKQDAGGIADIEFMVQYAALRWASRLGDYLGFTDNIRLLEGIADARLMDARDVELLTDAYRAYRARVHALALQQETTVKSDGDFDHYREGVVRIWRKLMED